LKFDLTNRWQEMYPQGIMGVLIMEGISKADPAPDLKSFRKQLEGELRQRYQGFDRSALKDIPTIKAYDEFYRIFKKTYHLLLQLESVLGGKPIPGGDPLVSAMFMAELEDLLLTAGHDFRKISGPVRFDVARGTEQYERMNGEQQVLKPGDLYTADGAGILSSVIYGPDHRTRIQPSTTAALFTTYGVPGIGSEKLIIHLQRLRDLILAFSPAAAVLKLEVIAS
jgi:DNA/RNA-binding domain of Phe-tRNA-synthetase-like protein